MSFATETEKLVNELIQAEYKNACEQFGDKFHSLHEGYAVLLEEVEETEEEINDMSRWIAELWSMIKNDDSEDIESQLEWIEVSIINAIEELAQAGAVVRKILTTREGVKDEN